MSMTLTSKLNSIMNRLILFSPITAQRERKLIESAIQSFQFLSCLKFKTWDGDPDKDYLHFQNSKARPG